MSIEQTDKALARYYAQFNTPYDNKPYDSKFKEWCDDNGVDDEEVQAQITEGFKADVVEFDDQFPLRLKFDEEEETKEQRLHKIYQIIKTCWDDPNAYMDQVQVEQSTEKKETYDDDDEKQSEEEITKDQVERVNGLVLCLTIAKYDVDTLPHLDTDKDESMYRALFENKYHYKFVTNAQKTMTEKQVETFLLKGRSELYDYNALKLNYDVLIVTYGGHGSHDSIICSDGGRFGYKSMRAIFQDKAFANIPKIFLIDACRTDDTKDNGDDNANETEKARSTTNIAKTFSITLMQSEGHVVRGANICQFITEELNANHEKKEYTDFRTVYVAAKQKLEEAIKNQTIIVSEYDIDVDKVKLMPCQRVERGTKDKRHQTDTKQTSSADFLRTFLAHIKMDQYYAHFKDNCVDSDSALRDVDENMLIKWGILKESDRKTLMKAIKQLE